MLEFRRKSLSLANFLSLPGLEFSEKCWKNKAARIDYFLRTWLFCLIKFIIFVINDNNIDITFMEQSMHFIKASLKLQQQSNFEYSTILRWPLKTRASINVLFFGHRTSTEVGFYNALPWLHTNTNDNSTVWWCFVNNLS